MSAIRILAGLGAAALFVLALRGYERRHISRLNLIILFGLCAAVVALADLPTAVRSRSCGRSISSAGPTA